MNRKSPEMLDFPARRHVSGAGGRVFESPRSDHFPSNTYGEFGERSETGCSPIRSTSSVVAPPFTPELVARFWSFVEKRGPDECWPWTGGKRKNGYGAFGAGRRVVTSSRYAYYAATNKWPGRYSVCHACDSPGCCNPAHLWLGSPSDNARDMVEKGRHGRSPPKGVDSPWSKLTEDDVRAIRRAFDAGESNSSIARRYGVHHSSIRNIRIGRKWKHVQEEAA